jgi:hypothetical protein
MPETRGRVRIEYGAKRVRTSLKRFVWAMTLSAEIRLGGSLLSRALLPKAGRTYRGAKSERAHAALAELG